MKYKLISLFSGTILAIIIIETIGYIFLNPGHLYKAFKVIHYDSRYLWSNIPENKTNFYNTKVKTNNLGLRHKHNEYSTEKIKILTLGGSPTFGWGVEGKSTYSYVLQDHLSDNYQVINGGMVGFSSFQGKKLFSDIVKKIKPQYVTVSYVVNDVDRFRFAYNNLRADHEVMNPHYLDVTLKNFMNQSYAYWAIRSLLSNNNRRTLSPNEALQLINKEARVPLTDYLNNIKTILSISKNHNIKVIFIIMPLNLPTESLCEDIRNMVQVRSCVAARCSKDAKKYNNALRDLALKNNLPFVDVAKRMENNKNIYFLIEKGDHIHPNDKGHRLIAKLIYDKLFSKDIKHGR